MKNTNKITAALAMAFALTAVPAKADILNLAKSSVGCAAQKSIILESTICDLSSNNNFATANVTFLPHTSAFASAFSPAGVGNTAQANAGITYYFQVIGGTPGDIVPVTVTGILQTSATQLNDPTSYAVAGMTFNSTLSPLRSAGIVCTYFLICNSGITEDLVIATFNTTSGDLNNFINMTAMALTNGAQGNKTTTAFADPYLYIDPSFPNADRYSIIVSSNVNNDPPGAATPEPASFGVVGLAICALSLIRKKRSRAKMQSEAWYTTPAL